MPRPRCELNPLIGAWVVTALSAIFIGLGLIGIPLVLILESLLTKSASRKIKSLPPAALMNLDGSRGTTIGHSHRVESIVVSFIDFAGCSVMHRLSSSIDARCAQP